MAGIRSRRDIAIAVPAIGGQPAVSAGLFVAPVILNVLAAQAGYDETGAATLISLEMTISALTTLGLSGIIRGADARRLAMLGAGLAVAGNLLSLASSAGQFLGLARALAGAGGGVLAAAIAVISVRARNPERLFSLQTICAIVVGSACLAIIPLLVPMLGYRAPYAVLLVVAGVATAFVRGLPTPQLATPHHARARSGGRFSAIGIVALTGIVLTQLGQGAFWTFVGQYGLQAGLTDVEVGGFLSMATLLLLVGVAGAAIAGARFGRIGPLVVLVAINALSILAIATARDPVIYVAANVVQAITNLSSVIFELGLAAALDRSGRLAAAAAGLVTLGNGLGPSLAGSIAASSGIGAIAIAVLALNGAALAAFAFVGSKLNTSGREA